MAAATLVSLMDLTLRPGTWARCRRGAWGLFLETVLGGWSPSSFGSRLTEAATEDSEERFFQYCQEGAHGGSLPNHRAELGQQYQAFFLSLILPSLGL